MHRFIRAACAACALSLVLATGAFAAAPVSSDCLGRSVSDFASQNGQELGQIVALTAQVSTQGVGDEVQLIQAGEFPDDAFPNVCND